MPGTKYNHKEAFCLMYYKCEKCNKIEKLWNSRDGVTPFVIRCRHCDGEAVHVMWQLDRFMPDYIPILGQRVFIDITKERAEEIAKKRIEHFNKLGYNDNENPEDLLNDVTKDIWQNGESPDIYTIKLKDLSIVRTEKPKCFTTGNYPLCKGASNPVDVAEYDCIRCRLYENLNKEEEI